MSQTADAPPGPEAWRAQNLRLIAFPRDPQFAVQQDWWRGLTGVDPENDLVKRQRQEKEASGPFQGTTLTLNIDLLRVQWAASPRLDAESIDLGDQPPILGPFLERKDWFRALMEQWLPRCPSIHRLAFTASLLQPVENHQAGYAMLDRYLRWVDIDPQSSEILYRINRRRDSGTGIPGLTLNRLSTWVVAKFAVLIRVIEGGHPEQQIQPTENFSCAVELDINTAPDFRGPLPHADLPRIFAELVEAGLEIAARGDARP
jgi:hypothetical protein